MADSNQQHFSYRDAAVHGAGNLARLWEEGISITGTIAERHLTLRHLEPAIDDLRFHARRPYRLKTLDYVSSRVARSGALGEPTDRGSAHFP